MRKYRILFLMILAVLFSALIYLGGCSEKISPTEDSTPVILNVKTEGPDISLQASYIFRLTISAEDIKTIVDTLVYKDGYIEGRIDIPVGEKRKFLLEVLDLKGEVLYRDETVRDIFPGITTEVDITLRPNVPMVFMTPHYQEVTMNDSFMVDVSFYNVHDVLSIEFDLLYSDGPLYLDDYDSTTVRLDPDLPENSFVSYGSISYGLNIYVGIDGGGVLTDENGNGHLLTAKFKTYADWVSDTALVNLFLTNPSIHILVDGARDSVLPAGEVYLDNAEALLVRSMGGTK